MDDIQAMRAGALEKLQGVGTPEALEEFRIQFLGAKGAVKAALGRLKEVSAPDRPRAGQAANDLKSVIQAAFDARAAEIASARKPTAGPVVDVTLPGARPRVGHTHIVTQTIEELCDIFAGMGFVVADGPEVEDERHNFDCLNMPPWHPARDELANFYVSEKVMLRSQTSTVQIRTMEKQTPPVRIISPGRVYRPDTVDATHTFMFHQIEGLYVDEGVSMVDLKSTLDQFFKAYFGPDISTRLRPSFFPFTEPSAELDTLCPVCHGKKCTMCKQSGWLEMGGCGMVDPNVLAAVGYDSDKYTGFAFGFGIDRLIMGKYGIRDIRVLFENDVRFLRQF
jgi:phenylalanyl-tRNA synthetase alpha chain